MENTLLADLFMGLLNLRGDSIYSSTEKIFIAKFSDNPFITSIKNINDNFELIGVFPNPSSGIFTVDLHNCQAGAKIVVRVYWETVLFEKNCQNDASPTIDLSSRPKGIYFMEIVSDGARSVNKIVLQ